MPWQLTHDLMHTNNDELALVTKQAALLAQAQPGRHSRTRRWLRAAVRPVTDLIDRFTVRMRPALGPAPKPAQRRRPHVTVFADVVPEGVGESLE